MDIGAFNCLVVFERRQAGRDEHGQPSTTWVEAFKRWTNIRNQSGAEMVRGDASTSIVRSSLRVLNCPSEISAGMRATYRGKVYEVKAVLPDETDQDHTDLVCEVVA
jgi:SPP1 family predicted phage head-tail adaptor